MVDEEGGSCRRRLHPCVRDEVDDAFVALVTDTRDDGQREVGYVLCQCQRVETAQVCHGSSASDDDHHVEMVGFVKDGVEGLDDGGFHGLALHGGGEEAGGKLQSPLVVLKLVLEVAVACCRLAADDGDTLGKDGQGNLLVEVYHALFL